MIPADFVAGAHENARAAAYAAAHVRAADVLLYDWETAEGRFAELSSVAATSALTAEASAGLGVLARPEDVIAADVLLHAIGTAIGIDTPGRPKSQRDAALADLMRGLVSWHKTLLAERAS